MFTSTPFARHAAGLFYVDSLCRHIACGAAVQPDGHRRRKRVSKNVKGASQSDAAAAGIDARHLRMK
jgi:hypothetical protein